MSTLRSIESLAQFVESLPASPRRIIGIAGSPGAGKSTIADALVARLRSAVVLPMDGYHLPQARLVELGRRDRMGAPDTFDVDGFLATLSALRAVDNSGNPVLAPGFDRGIEEPVPDAIRILQELSTVVVEGNYLLLANAPWWQVRPLLDLAVFIDVPREAVKARLLKRHAEHGLFSEARNREHVERVDLANYDLVKRSRGRADLAIDLVTEG